MIIPQKIIIIYFLLCLFPRAQYSYAQTGVALPELEKRFLEAVELMDAFQNDPAISILQSLEDTLIDIGELNSDFGLKVQDKFAEALEKDHKDERAIEKLTYLSKETNDREIWELYANTQLSLARLHEKMGRDKNCHKHLLLSKKIIEEHKLSELYPRFTIRFSSYHRLFAVKDSAIYYAQEAIRSCEELGLVSDKGVGHLLMGMLTADDAYEEAVFHFETAGDIWFNNGDHSGYSFAHNNLARIHFENGRRDLAMLHNDTTLVAAQRAIEMGHDYTYSIFTAYFFKANMYEEDGQLDSALHYNKLAYKLQLEESLKSNNEKIIEIDAKYNDEIKTQTIKDQQKLLESESIRKKLLWGLMGMFLFFSIILAFAYLRLLSASNRIKNQNVLISKTNKNLKDSLEQSQVLQSELHHRVKNNMQLIVGLIELQSEGINDLEVKRNLESMTQRIYSMAATHEAFNANNYNEELKLKDFINKICLNFEMNSFLGHSVVIEKEIENCQFSLDTLIPVGMILHELMTNSVKHFNDFNDILKIGIHVTKSNEYTLLKYKDNGPGFENDKMEQREGGLGNYLINSMVRQLDGFWETENTNGAVTSIYLKEKKEHEPES